MDTIELDSHTLWLNDASKVRQESSEMPSAIEESRYNYILIDYPKRVLKTGLDWMKDLIDATAKYDFKK